MFGENGSGRGWGTEESGVVEGGDCKVLSNLNYAIVAWPETFKCSLNGSKKES